jgi:hypothetical protein
MMIMVSQRLSYSLLLKEPCLLSINAASVEYTSCDTQAVLCSYSFRRVGGWAILPIIATPQAEKASHAPCTYIQYKYIPYCDSDHTIRPKRITVNLPWRYFAGRVSTARRVERETNLSSREITSKSRPSSLQVFNPRF